MPHSHTDNKKEEDKFTSCLMLSLHDKNGENYVQDGTKDEADKRNDFVEMHKKMGFLNANKVRAADIPEKLLKNL